MSIAPVYVHVCVQCKYVHVRMFVSIGIVPAVSSVLAVSIVPAVLSVPAVPTCTCTVSSVPVYLQCPFA